MPRFLLAPGAVIDGRAELTGDDAHHLARVLRARPGERIVVVSGGVEHGVVLDDVDSASVAGRVAWSRPATGEPRLRVHVVQALSKDGMDELVDSLAQGGVAAIHPVLSERVVARPDPARAAARVERWQTIARGGAGLGFRAEAPPVFPIAGLGVALEALPARTRLLGCDFEDPEAVPLQDAGIDATVPLAICIGPEGGWDDLDRARLRAHGASPVHLGPRVFRTRLAGAVALALALAAAGDLRVAYAPPPW